MEATSAEAQARTNAEADRSLRNAWILMLIVGLVSFGYEVGVAVTGLYSIAANNPAAWAGLGIAPTVDAAEENSLIFFWGLFIIILSWKGLRRGISWVWYPLMLVPVRHLVQYAVHPSDGYISLPLTVLSAIAIALPYKYYASKRHPPQIP